jgi:hypothetical protein
MSAVRISVVGVSAARTLAADGMRYERRVSEVLLSPAATCGPRPHAAR